MTTTTADPDGHEETSIVDKGMADLPRNDDGEVDHDALIAYVAKRVDFDAQAERRKKAIRLIGAKRKPGSTKSDGQLCIDGVDAYDYEPSRLVLSDPDADGKTTIIENSRALAKIKQAEARRKMKKARESMRQAERALGEASGHSDWTVERMQKGEELSDLPFGRFVRDAGVHIEDQP